MPLFAAVYGVRPWELELLSFGELDEMVSQLPDVIRRLGQVEHVTYKG